jgi:hypothetical protein
VESVSPRLETSNIAELLWAQRVSADDYKCQCVLTLLGILRAGGLLRGGNIGVASAGFLDFVSRRSFPSVVVFMGT